MSIEPDDIVTERPLTRLFSFLLGLIFIVTPLLACLNEKSIYEEIKTESISVQIFFLFLFTLMPCLGGLLLYVAKNGKVPKWFDKFSKYDGLDLK